MSLLTLLRGDRQPQLKPEPPIVEDTFVPAPQTPPPADNIVLLDNGQELAFFEEHVWSINGTAALREAIMRLPGDSTVITWMPMRSADLHSLKRQHAWNSHHSDPKKAVQEKGSAITSLLIRSVIIVESHEHQHVIPVNPGASCDVVIISTDYLDDICHRYDCRTMKDPHKHCTWLAYKEVLTSVFQTRRNFEPFAPSDEQVDDILAGNTLADEHVNSVRVDLRHNVLARRAAGR
jgi:hypothetical protein